MTVVSGASYEPFGPARVLPYGNGLTQARGFYTDGSPEFIMLVDSASYDLFDARGYVISNAGNLTEIVDYVGTDTRDYGYDNLDRLTWDSRATTSSPTYSYDANGNRLTRAAGTYAAQSATYVANSNRQTGISHDGMGNQLAAAGGTQFFSYAANGRLGLAQENLDALRLDYNGLGELARTRLERQDLCTVNMILLAEDDYNFLPDGRALSRRTTNTVAVNADYVWLDNLPVAQFQDSYDSQGTYQGTTVTWLHADHLGTPRLGTNGSQQVTWRYESDAFGIATLSGTAVVGLRFPGQQSLGIAGLNYNYYRDYVPDRGRYLESDPIGLNGGLNTYGYVLQNPGRFIDPLGLEVRFICRPLTGGIGRVSAVVYGATQEHCFVYVSCPGKGDRVLSLFGPFAGRKSLSTPGTPGLRDDPFSAYNTVNIEIRPNMSVCADECAFEEDVLQKFMAFPSWPTPYFPTGPNSNNFAEWLVTSQTFGTRLPPGAAPNAPRLHPRNYGVPALGIQH